MKEMILTGQYAAFADIAAENLDTLLPCIGAEVVKRHAGEPLLKAETEEKKCALILTGSALAAGDGRELTLKAGTVIGKSFYEQGKSSSFNRITASEDCTLLLMNYEGMTVPCWFSCFFHACFIDNLEKLRKRQQEWITDPSVSYIPFP